MIWSSSHSRTSTTASAAGEQRLFDALIRSFRYFIESIVLFHHLRLGLHHFILLMFLHRFPLFFHRGFSKWGCRRLRYILRFISDVQRRPRGIDLYIRSFHLQNAIFVIKIDQIGAPIYFKSAVIIRITHFSCMSIILEALILLLVLIPILLILIMNSRIAHGIAVHVVIWLQGHILLLAAVSHENHCIWRHSILIRVLTNCLIFNIGTLFGIILDPIIAGLRVHFQSFWLWSSEFALIRFSANSLVGRRQTSSLKISWMQLALISLRPLRGMLSLIQRACRSIILLLILQCLVCSEHLLVCILYLIHRDWWWLEDVRFMPYILDHVPFSPNCWCTLPKRVVIWIF